MMGSNDKPQNELFYAFNLENLVPQDHLLRSIDRYLFSGIDKGIIVSNPDGTNSALLQLEEA